MTAEVLAFLEVLKASLDGALGNLIWWGATSPWQEAGIRWALKVSSSPSHLINYPVTQKNKKKKKRKKEKKRKKDPVEICRDYFSLSILQLCPDNLKQLCSVDHTGC